MPSAGDGLDIMPATFDRTETRQGAVVWTLLGLGVGLVAGAAGAAWYLLARDGAASQTRDGAASQMGYDSDAGASGEDDGGGVSTGGLGDGTAEAGKAGTTNIDLGSSPYGTVPYSAPAHDADAVADLDVNSLDAVAAGELATGGVSADAGTPDSILSSLDDGIGVDIGGESAISSDILQGRHDGGQG